MNDSETYAAKEALINRLDAALNDLNKSVDSKDSDLMTEDDMRAVRRNAYKVAELATLWVDIEMDRQDKKVR